MRHLKEGRKLKRTASHRKATLSSLCTALIVHKRIKTTVAKAKEARRVVEPLITRAKRAVSKEKEGGAKNVAARRLVFAALRSRAAVKELFNEIAPKVLSRPGGYTRVVKLGRRLGDGAELAVLELVDFSVGATETKKKTKPATGNKAETGTKESQQTKQEVKRQEQQAQGDQSISSDEIQQKDST
ncbi:MAG: 50S ribosomal protein L17 [Bacteroidetes bacterium]|nr:50S ribosomal protein L17 [Bacteroidota bacterium]